MAAFDNESVLTSLTVLRVGSRGRVTLAVSMQKGKAQIDSL